MKRTKTLLAFLAVLTMTTVAKAQSSYDFQAVTPQGDTLLCTIVDIDPYAIFSRQVNRHDYAQIVRGDSPDAEILAISCDSKTLSIFHTSNAAEIHAVFHYNYPESINQDN